MNFKAVIIEPKNKVKFWPVYFLLIKCKQNIAKFNMKIGKRTPEEKNTSHFLEMEENVLLIRKKSSSLHCLNYNIYNYLYISIFQNSI